MDTYITEISIAAEKAAAAAPRRQKKKVTAPLPHRDGL
jgi:hypothetical protein